jgi:hypothetical protein
MNHLGVRRTCIMGMGCLLSGIVLFFRIGASADYTWTILPSTILCQFSMGMCIPTLSIAAVIGIQESEQGLAAGLQGTVGQAGGGLMLAITTAMMAISTGSHQGTAQTSASSVVAQLDALHAGLLVIAASAALGAIIALIGIKTRPPTAFEEQVKAR